MIKNQKVIKNKSLKVVPGFEPGSREIAAGVLQNLVLGYR